MKEREAKKILRKMLRTFTVGSVLHLLGDIHKELAEDANRVEDAVAFERCQSLHCTLYVVGLGVDAVCPR